jgi:diguanylate cyclase
MPAAPLPDNELARLKALADLEVLDSSEEEEFTALVQIAALVCDVPISLISLVDSERQWFKANVGLPGVTETSRDTAFCSHAIHKNGLLEVEDATLDPRFSDNPFVVEDPRIRFYAGATLTLSTGENVGTLCVVDTKIKTLNDKQRAILHFLAAAVVKALEGRRALLSEHALMQELSAMAIELTESELRFRALSDASPLGIYSTDANGSCTYTNKRWQEIYDMTLEESLGGGWQNGLHPDDKGSVFTTWMANSSSGREFDFEFRVRHNNGNIRFVHSRAKPTFGVDKSISGFVGTVQDVTETKHMQRENNALLNLVRSNRIMSVQNVRGHIVEANDAFCAISQYSREELLNKNHRILNSGFHSPIFFANMWNTITQSRHWTGEICNRAKDGTLYWVEAVIAPLQNSNGEVDRYISIANNITPRKKQEEELRKSQELLNRTGQIAGIGGWEFDLVSKLLYWSDETCRIHGLEPGYVPTLDEAIQFYAPEARPIIQAAVERSIVTGESWDFELPFIQAGGQAIWVRAAGTAEIENGKPRRLVGTFQNITEQVSHRAAAEAVRNRMNIATDSGEIGVWEYDLAEGSLVWDEWMYKLYGLTPGEGIGPYELWAKHLHPDDKIQAEKALQDAINNIAPFDTEFRIVWADASVHHLRATARVTRDEQGIALKMIGANWDVSTLRGLASELAQEHELLQVTLKSIGDAVITTDAQGNTKWLNPIAERMTGWTVDEAKGRPLAQVFNIVNEDTRLKTENPVATCLAQGKIVGLANHTLLISRNGDEYGVEDSAAPIRNADGEVLGVVLVFHDVTEQRRLTGEISYQATHDTLTGLINRMEFETRLRRLLEKTHEGKSTHAIMYIDLDQFKIVNDACGHSVGDELLQKIAKLLSETVRTRDTLARLGGDEFGVILEHCTTDQAQRVAQQICDNMDEFRFIHDNHRFRIGTSIGLVAMDNRWTTTAALMQAADTSCYAAKEAGRNRVHVWFDTDQAMRTRQGEMQWTTRIEQALDENRFQLYAQRIEHLNDESHGIHAEVLLRMIDADGTLIPPGAFLPAAERFHLASRIDRWVLRAAIRWLLERGEGSRAIDMLCINLSGQSIGDRAFHRQAAEMLLAAGSKVCTQLCLEITETAAVTNLADASLFIEQVSNLGVRIALDDFGAGASSFGYLKNLDVDILKIDGQFIRDIMKDPLNEVAVRCFIDVAKVLNLKTVAEFVDKPEVLQRIRELGVDYAQGFLLHKPEPIDIAIGSLVVVDEQQNSQTVSKFAK